MHLSEPEEQTHHQNVKQPHIGMAKYSGVCIFPSFSKQMNHVKEMKEKSLHLQFAVSNKNTCVGVLKMIRNGSLLFLNK